MRILQATVPEEMQTHSFVFNIPGMISLKAFPLMRDDGDDKYELQEFLKETDKMIQDLNAVFPGLFQNLELIYAILHNYGYMVLRDTRRGNFYFELFFKEVDSIMGEYGVKEILEKMFDDIQKEKREE